MGDTGGSGLSTGEQSLHHFGLFLCALASGQAVTCPEGGG